jgi:hypothetical protein
VLSDGISVNITDCSYENNLAISQGAAIYMNEDNTTSIAQMQVSRSVFRGNTAQQADGGAVVILGKAILSQVFCTLYYILLIVFHTVVSIHASRLLPNSL